MNNIISSGNELLKFNSGEVIEVSEVLPTPMPMLWLKSNTGIVKDTNERVSQWQDQSPNQYHANQSTASAQPLFVTNHLNGHPSLYFNGSNFLINLDLSIASSKSTLFIVFNPTTWAGSQNYAIHFSIGSHSSGFWSSVRSTFEYITVWENGVIDSPAQSIYLDTNYLLSYSGGKLYLNGFLVSETQLGVSSGTGFRIGNLISGLSSARNWNGYITEVIYYNTEFTAEEIAILNNYLITKYAL